MPRISAATIGEHRAQTQDRILQAVSRLSRHQGIDAISMTDVAVEAEITRTVLYNYFPDKAALLLAFTERVTHYFIEAYERELPENASPPSGCGCSSGSSSPGCSPTRTPAPPTCRPPWGPTPTSAWPSTWRRCSAS
nr:hypothetical protein GCM10020093_003580 [Planobispora longispora]